MKKISIYITILIFGLLFIFFSYYWFLEKQQRVLNGSASPKFPYPDYSDSELEKLFPHDAENTAPTVQSPEQTHQMFLAALKKEDFDTAVNCCFREGDRAKMKDFLLGLKNKGQLDLMMNDISEIHKNIENSWEATYIYSGTYKGKKIGSFMIFTKTSKGYWYIESL